MALKLFPDAQPSTAKSATPDRGFECLNALTSRMDVPVCFEGIDASQAGASGSADLGGSSKYSGE